MNRSDSMPIALTIAGSDSGGGAGIQADLKTFASLGVHGTTVITCLTAQNPTAVLGVEPCTPKLVRLQLEAVFSELPPAAAKTGMLYSAGIIKTVADFFRSARFRNLVVDPVMVSTSGAQLLERPAVARLESALLPLCALMTPNLDEASLLAKRKLVSVDDLRSAAREFNARYGCAVLLKGGHLRNSIDAIDVFWDGRDEHILKARFIKGVSTHGTGCTYSAAITAWLARGETLAVAVTKAKDYITKAIAGSRRIAAHTVLNSFWSYS